MFNIYLVYYKYTVYDVYEEINTEQNCVITLTRSDLVEARHDVNVIKKKICEADKLFPETPIVIMGIYKLGLE